MQNYELRLYKRTAPEARKHVLADRIPFEATDDDEAISRAPHIEVAVFDDSDLAVLFGEDGQMLWMLKATEEQKSV